MGKAVLEVSSKENKVSFLIFLFLEDDGREDQHPNKSKWFYFQKNKIITGKPPTSNFVFFRCKNIRRLCGLPDAEPRQDGWRHTLALYYKCFALCPWEEVWISAFHPRKRRHTWRRSESLTAEIKYVNNDELISFGRPCKDRTTQENNECTVPHSSSYSPLMSSFFAAPS